MSQIFCVGDHSLESHDDVIGAEWLANLSLHELSTSTELFNPQRLRGGAGVCDMRKSALHFFYEPRIQGSVLKGRPCLSVLWWNGRTVADRRPVMERFAQLLWWTEESVEAVRDTWLERIQLGDSFQG